MAKVHLARRRHLLWGAPAALAVAALLATSGCSSQDFKQLTPGATQVNETPPPATGTQAKAKLAPRVAGAPTRVTIPALHVNAPVLPVQAPNRTLIPPGDPQKLGWWADGAKPGAREGSALIAGHTVSTGGGALDDLENLAKGDRIMVHTDKGVIRYRVRSVAVFSKGFIAKDAERLFSQNSRGRLVLLTCEGWDGVRYNSNVVVTALPE